MSEGPAAGPATPADAVRAVLDLPLHRHLGLDLLDRERPELGTVLPVSDHTVNPSGVLHGGLVPLLLDVTCYLALLPSLEPGSQAVTVGTSSSLLAAAPRGTTVRCTATLERRGRTLVFLSARVVDGERLLATGQVVKSLSQPR